MKLNKHSKNPILKPNPTVDWENLAVCNPAIWNEEGKFHLLYRAAGDDEEHIIRFGLAKSEDGVNFQRVSGEPAFSPSQDGPDSGGVEDPRIAKFDDELYITYAYRPYAPGQYWTFEHDVVRLPDTGPNAPKVYRENIANTGLASTRDFKNWIRYGRMTESNLDNRDVILFPEKIKGKFVLLHRPKEWIGEEYGCEHPSIWITFSDDLMVWNEPSTLLLAGREGTWEEKVGGGPPPVKTDDGWLMLYHGVEKGGQGYYRVGALLLDLDDPTKILGKTEDWIMEPDQYYELEGFYKGCVFPTGNVIVGEELYVYYGAADKYIGLATCKLQDLLKHLKNNNT